MKAFIFVIVALGAMALADARVCLMSNIEMSAVNASKLELDNFGMQDCFIGKSFMVKLNETIFEAIKLAAEPALSHLNALKEKVNHYFEAVQTKNKELTESLKAITQKDITAEDECLKKLKTMEDEEKINNLSCDIAIQFQTITNRYMQEVNKTYESYKREIIPHLDNINMNGDAILLDIERGFMNTPEQTCGVVDYFINMALNNFANDMIHQGNFKRIITDLANAADNQYKELDQQIGNSFPYRDGRIPQQ